MTMAMTRPIASAMSLAVTSAWFVMPKSMSRPTVPMAVRASAWSAVNITYAVYNSCTWAIKPVTYDHIFHSSVMGVMHTVIIIISVWPWAIYSNLVAVVDAIISIPYRQGVAPYPIATV
jgi:hypothetical protein